MKPDTTDLPEARPLAAFDTEDDSNGTVTQIVLVLEDGTAHHLEPTPAAFLGAVLSLDPDTVIFAHNIEYDVGNALRGFLSHCRPLLGGGGRLIGVDIANGPRLRCTFAHYRRSLKFIGGMVGRKKLDRDVNDPAYCEEDTRICLDAAKYLEKFYRSVNAKFSATSSGAALSQFTRNFLDREQPIPLADHRSWQGWACAIREAYYGGRSECFRIGEQGHTFAADINSAYPWAMATLPYPDTSTARPVRRFNLDHEGVCYATIKIPSRIRRAPLPFRTKAGNVYPVGTVAGWWAAPELRYAAACGCRVETGRGVEFSGVFRPFSDFVRTHYDVKAGTSDAAERFFRKLLMNSLYGMFGLSPDRQVYTTKIPATGKYVPWGKGAIIPSFNIAPFANQIWAVYTTAYVRVRLAELMDETERRGGDVVYCDTDSIYYRADSELWPTTDALGALSADGRAPFRIVAPKCYSFGDVVKCKGIKNARAAHLDGLAESWETPSRLLVALKKSEAVNVWRKTTRGIYGEYTRRNVLPGGDTTPLSIRQVAHKRS